MPFTFSHPAIVLPLKKLFGPLSLTGLVIGSTAPDFEYFIRMRAESWYSHTIPGIFYYDLPLATVLSFIYHLIVRNPLIDNLPVILNERLSVFKAFDWTSYFKAHWFTVIISIIIGAASHIFWDSFTHPNGYFVDTIPFLQKTITAGGLTVSYYKIAQHLSTLIGGAVVLWAIFSLPATKNPTPLQNKYVYWIAAFVVTVAVLTAFFFTHIHHRHYKSFIVTGISGFLIGLIITPYLTKSSEKA